MPPTSRRVPPPLVRAGTFPYPEALPASHPSPAAALGHGVDGHDPCEAKRILWRSTGEQLNELDGEGAATPPTEDGATSSSPPSPFCHTGPLSCCWLRTALRRCLAAVCGRGNDAEPDETVPLLAPDDDDGDGDADPVDVGKPDKWARAGRAPRGAGPHAAAGGPAGHPVTGIPLGSDTGATSPASNSTPLLPYEGRPMAAPRPLSPLRRASVSKIYAGCAPAGPAAPSPSNLYDDAMDHRCAFQSATSLQAYLDRYNPHLPVQLSVQADTTAPQVPGAVEPLLLVARGPVRVSPHAALLGLMEDVLLEDCDPALPLTALLVSDIRLGADGPPRPAPNRCALLADFLVAPDELPGDGAAAGAMLEASQRVSILLHNLLEEAAALRTLCLRRVVCPPPALERLMASLGDPSTLCRLLFEQCPLTTAHIESMVRAWRGRNAAANAGSSGAAALSRLTELQLSGPLTADSAERVLDYFEETWAGPQCLRVLRVPPLLAAEVQQRPFALAHPELCIEPPQVLR
eukprot:gene8312-5826_t